MLSAQRKRFVVNIFLTFFIFCLFFEKQCVQKQTTQNGQTENVYIISINCRDKIGTNGTNAGYQNGTNVALLLSKNGGQPKCFAGIHLINLDFESNKRRY